MNEESIIAEIRDDLTYILTNIVSNVVSDSLGMDAAPNATERTIFFAVNRYVYDLLPNKCINISGNEYFDKYFYLMGPQLIFTSLYTSNNRAVLGDIINLTINLLRDLYGEYIN